MNPSSSPESVQPAPTQTMQDKKKLGFKGVISTVMETNFGTPNTFRLNGREYAIKTPLDAAVAEAQLMVKAVSDILQEAEAEKDYIKATSAAQLLGLVKSNLDITLRYAEYATDHPEATPDLIKKIPILAALSSKTQPNYLIH